MTDVPVSIDDTTPLPVNLPDISTGISTPQPSYVTANNRAAQTKFGLSKVIDKSHDELVQTYLQGNEPSVRQEASSALDEQTRAKRSADLTAAAIDPSPTSYAKVKDILSSPTPFSDPRSVVEDSFAAQYMKYLNWPQQETDQNSWLDDARATLPEQTADTISQGSQVAARRMFAQTMLEDAQDTEQHQGWPGYIGDKAKDLVTAGLYGEIKLRGQVPGVSSFTGGLLGENLEAQAQKLLSIPDDNEFKTTFTGIMDHLKSDNPGVAVQFANAVLGQSQSERVLNNIGTIFNVVTAGDIGKDIGKMALHLQTKAAVKDLVVSLKNVPEQSIKVAAATGAGDLSEAAIQTTTAQILKTVQGRADVQKDAVQALTSIHKANMDVMRDNPGRYGQEITNRIIEHSDNSIITLGNAIETAIKVDRTPPALATEQGVRVVQAIARDAYPGLRNAILDIKPFKDEATNILKADIILGTNQGEFFSRFEVAKNFAKVNKLVAASIERQNAGVGYYIRLTHPINETDPRMRDILASTAESKTPESILTWWRTPEETMSVDQQRNRKAAMYGPAIFKQIYKDALDPVRRLARGDFGKTEYTPEGKIVGPLLRRQRYSEWKDVVEGARDIMDPDTKKMGYFFKTEGELEQEYLKRYNRLPHAVESEAYFSFKTANEIDAVMRSLAMYRSMSRIGTKQYAITSADASGKIIKSNFFPGIKQNVFPGGDDTILLLEGQHGSEQLLRGGRYSPKLVGRLKEAIEKGEMSVVQLWNPEERPLNSFSKVAQARNSRIRYVVTKNVETKALDYDQLPRRGGGHVEYDYDHYIKQAIIHPELIQTEAGEKIFHHWYEGDKTLMPISDRVLGQDLINNLEKVRDALARKDLTRAKEAAKELPIEWKEIAGWFKRKKNPETGLIDPPMFNVNEPFKLVPKNKAINDLDDDLSKRYANFKDGTRQGSLARQYAVEFTGERDARDVFTINNKGTRTNPAYSYDAATKVDAITSMNRGLSRIVNSTYMDDYKAFSMEHWLQEARPYLDEKHPGEIRTSPFYYFHHAEFKKGVDPYIQRQFEVARYQIKALTGIQSPLQARMASWGQTLADSIYTNYGAPGVKAKFNLATSVGTAWGLAGITNGSRYLRATVYHATIGLFNHVQLLVQSMNYATIFGIEGGLAIPGSMGAALHQLSRFNAHPNIMEALDKVASTLHIPGTSKWKPGEWLEGWRELAKTGFAIVGGEHITLPHELTPTVFRGPAGDILNAGEIFFKGAERNARFGAWYTAFKKWKDANPGKTIDNAARLEILNRADLLAGNMTTSSKSMLQKGPGEFTTQFLGYQLRMLEQMTGKRLNTQEKMRLFATFGMLFGFPSALGLGGLPFGDSIRKYAIEHGYDTNTDGLTNWAMEGIPSEIIHLATGNRYNIGQRYGAPAFDAIRDAMSGDKPWWTIVGGAATSELAGAWDKIDGFYNVMMDPFRTEDQVVPLKADDLVEPLKVMSEFNNGWRYAMALHTRNWVSSKGIVLDEVSPLNATFLFATGLQPQDAADLQAFFGSMKDTKGMEEKAEKEFQREYRRFVIAMHDNNPEQAEAYWKSANAYLAIVGYPRNKMPTLLHRVAQDNETLIKSTKWDFYLGRNVPEDQKAARQQMYEEILKRQKDVQ